MATSSDGVAESRSGPRKRAVRWNEPSLLRTEVGEDLSFPTIFGEAHHAPPSRGQVLGIAQVPAHDLDEGGVALGRPDRGEVADQPDRSSREPEPEAQSDRRGKRAVQDGDRPRRAT
jgi:hypothetical protein